MSLGFVDAGAQRFRQLGQRILERPILLQETLGLAL